MVRRTLLKIAAVAPLQLRAAGRRISNITVASNPYGLRIGPDGALYVCEIGAHRISRIDLRSGAVTPVLEGQKEPYDLRFDRKGLLFFVDMPAHQVKSFDQKTGTLTVIAGTGEPGFSGDGGPAVSAQLRQPHSIAFDPAGRLLICDIGNKKIRIVDNGTISTFATLNGPRALDFDDQGVLYVALREGNAVLRLDPKTGQYESIAKTFKFSGPKGISCSADKSIYLADTESHTIRKIDPSGAVSVVAGTGSKSAGSEGDPLACGLSRPHGVFVDAKGTVFIGDSENNLVRQVS